MPVTDKHSYNLTRLHEVFALSSVTLLVATVWMLAADHSDEWRAHQSTMDRLEAGRIELEQAAVKARLGEDSSRYDDRVDALRERHAQTRLRMEAQHSDLPDLRHTLQHLEQSVELARRKIAAERSARDAYRAQYDLAVRDRRNAATQQKLKDRFDKKCREIEELELEFERRQTQRDEASARLKKATEAYDRVSSELEGLTAEMDRLQRSLDKIEPDNWFAAAKRRVMLWPIIDGFNSPHRIVNDWLPELSIQLGMTKTARFDRCRTCHKGIDRVEAGNIPAFPFGDVQTPNPQEWIRSGRYPHPFATHPRLDLYLTNNSPHPLAQFGCTICHEGQGSATSFANAEHTANDPHQARNWADQYDAHPDRFWEYPMLPRRLRESACLKCHHAVVDLGINGKYGPTAPKLYEGWQLLRTYGCFGCHEISGDQSGVAVGPDMRLAPNYQAVAQQILALVTDVDSSDPAFEASTWMAELRDRATQIVQHPDTSHDARVGLQGMLGPHALSQTNAMPSDVRDVLGSPGLRSLVDALDDQHDAGVMGKVGPSLRRLGQKTTAEWIGYWLEAPRRFRSRTRMPHFFDRVNQRDATAQRFLPVERAGIAQYLLDESQPTKLLDYREAARAAGAVNFAPDPERGRIAFRQSGCLACHRHKEFPEITTNFAPGLFKVHLKLQVGRKGFDWLYTWIRNPRHHASETRMPRVFLDPEGKQERYRDPAADIAAFLLQQGPGEYPALEFDESALDELVLQWLGKAIGRVRAREVLASKHGAGEPFLSQARGPEIELAGRPITREMKLRYVGRKAIANYGCFGCHDIPGFETARPIGPALSAWGRKDTNYLAFNHIREYLDEYGEPDGTSTRQRIERALKKARSDGFASAAEEEHEMRAAFFYASLLRQDRAGFLWQKLRQPRSYDFRKIETKDYDERLRMPHFNFTEQQIEAIATFVLGLVAEPPAARYVRNPVGPDGDIVAGARAWQKYNCGGCHIRELPEVRYGVDLDDVYESGLQPGEHPESVDLLLKLKPPRKALTGETKTFVVDGEQKTLPVGSFRGLLYYFDPEEDPEYQEYAYDLWETLDVDGKRMFPGTRMLVPASKLIERKPADGGDYAEWLVNLLMQQGPAANNRALAWQMAPPPLYQEGLKVQTPWLYDYLKAPRRLRPITILRMPQFNLSEAETRALANYFAAKDNAPYPYEPIPQRNIDSLTARDVRFRSEHPNRPNDYLAECWETLNGPLCIKCHSLAGRSFRIVDPAQDIRGPDLNETADRLRPDWLSLWLFNPRWIAPYTSMPLSFPSNQQQFQPLFDGNPLEQTLGVRDALMNYHRLMEEKGPYVPPSEAPADP